MPSSDLAARVERPWRTSRLPRLVGTHGAAAILGVNDDTIERWLKPGTGPYGPDGTRLISPRRMDVDGEGDGWPVWDASDIERFRDEIGRQRAPVGQAGIAAPAVAADGVVRPWRTSRLPRLVSAKGAAVILGVTKVTLNRWMRPGSGKPGASFGEQQTRMCPWVDVEGARGPVWRRDDVERFAAERGRQRALPGEGAARE